MIGKSSLGTVFVAGRKRVPKPATGITAFLIFINCRGSISHPFGFSLGDFLAGLAIDTQRRHRASLESFNADLFAALFTDAEFAGFQSLQSLLDLEDQFSLAIAYSQDRIATGFHRSAVAWIGKVFVLVHIVDCLAGFGPEFLDPLVQQVPEKFNFFFVQWTSASQITLSIGNRPANIKRPESLGKNVSFMRYYSPNDTARGVRQDEYFGGFGEHRSAQDQLRLGESFHRVMLFGETGK